MSREKRNIGRMISSANDGDYSQFKSYLEEAIEDRFSTGLNNAVDEAREAQTRNINSRQGKRLFPQKAFTHMDKHKKGRIVYASSSFADDDSLSGRMTQTRNSANPPSDYVCDLLVDRAYASHEYSVSNIGKVVVKDNLQITSKKKQHQYGKT